MEYIDKSKSREWAHLLIKNFLQKLLDEDRIYPIDLYEALRRDTDIKNMFVSRLLEDNNNRCCYCMRDIRGTTLEHVIPQDVKTKEEFIKYFEFESDLDISNIMLTQEFLENHKEVPPYPHAIAYENLIPSCLGHLPSNSKSTKCCNHYRGNKNIYPLVFRKNINKEVEYKADGSIVWTEDPEPEIPTVSKLGLDCLELKAIRRIWHYLVNHNMDYREDKDSIYKVIDDLLIESGIPKNSEERNMQEMLLNFKKNDYWKLLKDYSYFNNKEIFR